MGIFDKLGLDPSKIVNKLMGMNTQGSEDAKRKIREIFDAKAADGGSYTLVAGFFVTYENKLTKQVQTYYNYIIGYKDGDDPEMAVLPVSADLAEIYDLAVCKSSQCRKADYDSANGTFHIAHDALENGEVKFGIIPSTSMFGGYIIKVSYADEMMTFLDFFQKRYCK